MAINEEKMFFFKSILYPPFLLRLFKKLKPQCLQTKTVHCFWQFENRPFLIWVFLFCVCTISPLSPKVRFVARSGPPFVIRAILIQWERSGLQMADLNERNNGVWGRERGDRANTEHAFSYLLVLPAGYVCRYVVRVKRVSGFYFILFFFIFIFIVFTIKII